MKLLNNIFIIIFIILLPMSAVASSIDAERYIKNGKKLLESGKPQDAILEFQKALAADLNNSDATFYIGIAYHQMGQLDLAIQNYQKVSQILPDFPGAYYYTGMAYYDKGEPQKALEFLDKAIKKDDKYIEPYYLKAVIYYDKGDLNEAINMWEKILSIDRTYAGAELNIAIAYFYKGKATEAIQRAERAFRLKPGDQLINFNLGWLYLKTGDMVSAKKSFQKTIELCKETPFSWKSEALLAIMDNKTDQALEAIQKALDKNPNDASALIIAGQIWEKKGDKEKAIAAYQKSITIDKNDPEPQKALQRLLSN